MLVDFKCNKQNTEIGDLHWGHTFIYNNLIYILTDENDTHGRLRCVDLEGGITAFFEIDELVEVKEFKVVEV